jgi:hypothetical protein
LAGAAKIGAAGAATIGAAGAATIGAAGAATSLARSAAARDVAALTGVPVAGGRRRIQGRWRTKILVCATRK